jgi:hypothetical protein
MDAGNHEAGTDELGCLQHYVHRFDMPMKARRWLRTQA